MSDLMRLKAVAERWTGASKNPSAHVELRLAATNESLLSVVQREGAEPNEDMAHLRDRVLRRGGEGS